MNKRKVPKIRFKGFYDDWEQRKLADIVERITRKNENLESTLPLTISAQYGLIDQNEFFDKRIASKDVSGYYLVRKGEFAYNKSTSSDAPWGAIKRLDRYACGVLSTLYIVFRILDEDKVNSDYLVTYYDTDLWHKGVQAIAAEGARNHGLLNIAPADFFETTVSVPKDIEEQRKIGAYIMQLDHVITLHQRKLEKLKIIKKSMLENCFPKNGEKAPKIRFFGFSDDWEQRKLGDIYIERNERGNTELDILSVSIHHGISKNELASDELGKSVRRSDDKSLYKHVYYGDLVFNMMRAWQGAIGVARNEGMVSPAYISAIPNGSIFPEYMDYCLRRKCIINQINNLSYGVTDFRKRLYWEPFTRVTIMMPSVDEQRKITDVLSRLDHLITLHQSKLEKLKMIKKSMLETMFV